MNHLLIKNAKNDECLFSEAERYHLDSIDSFFDRLNQFWNLPSVIAENVCSIHFELVPAICEEIDECNYSIVGFYAYSNSTFKNYPKLIGEIDSIDLTEPLKNLNFNSTHIEAGELGIKVKITKDPTSVNNLLGNILTEDLFSRILKANEFKLLKDDINSSQSVAKNRLKI